MRRPNIFTITMATTLFGLEVAPAFSQNSDSALAAAALMKAKLKPLASGQSR